ncbi:MAG: MFS transporter [Geminicoccaceae bacterium]
MRGLNDRLANVWSKVGTDLMPFADVVTPDLPLSRLLRLSLFQVSVGMVAVLLIGTLNRVMIVELGVPAGLVAVMVALPLLFAPARALVGFRSDHHRSVLGWRRVPYLWFGTLLQFGGLAIMPFALLVLSGDGNGPIWAGQVGAALAFLLLGAGMHTTQTVGLALATDLVQPRSQPKVVALLCVMMMLGMALSALAFGFLLMNFSQIRLIQVIQGVALATMLLNLIALWKQEPRNPSRTDKSAPRPSFRESWNSFSRGRRATRRLVAVAVGTAGFSMQDILLEPYGGQILGLSVGQTTALTALLAAGGLMGFLLAAHVLGRGADPYRIAALGTLVGIVAFTAVIFAAPFESALLFALGVMLIGLGGGLFAHATLTAAMSMARESQIGLALGAWSAAQATAAGAAIAVSGAIRDLVSGLAAQGLLGPAISGPATGYGAVYLIEIGLLFATLAAIGPLVRSSSEPSANNSSSFGLAEIPG